MRVTNKTRDGLTLSWVLAVLALLPTFQCWAADQRYEGVISLTTVTTACKPFALAVGQRLQRPGKERITGAGSLYRVLNGTGQTVPVQIVWQIPLRIRIDGAGPTIILDRTEATAPGQAALDASDIVEALLDDSVEGMVSITGQLGASRLLGTGFREKGAPVTAPVYDIVQLVYPNVLRNGKSTGKAYWFESKTKLLARVVYESPSGGSVEVSVSNWQNVNGENIPFLIERRENGQAMMRLSLSSALVTAGAQDATFGVN